jgi:transcriptional regulator EpsA
MNGKTDPNDVAVLSANDQECLLRAIEFAQPIRNRGQLFVWAQVYLHWLIAHEHLLCAYGDFRRPNVNILKISTRSFTEKQTAEIFDPMSGLVVRAIVAWYESGEEPLAVYPGEGIDRHYERFRGTLERCSLENFVVHGARNVDGTTGAYFVLAGIPHAFGARHAYLFHLIMPHLRKTLERILASECRQQILEAPDTPPAAAKRLLTQREVNVLQLVQAGEGNKEIGIILKISPATVKNHMQNILKKLRAQNRAQAVSQAISLKLLK